MRRRIIIGSLAVVVIGVVAFWISQPKRGTVEWHAAKCRTAYHKMNRAQAWRIRAHDLWNVVRGKEKSYYQLDQYEERERHQRALISLGYLEEREFVLSNQPADKVIAGGNHWRATYPHWVSAHPEFFSLTTGETNVLIIVATGGDMRVVAEAIRTADMP